MESFCADTILNQITDNSVLNRIKNNPQKPMLSNNWLDMDQIDFLSTTVNYPLRFQKPLNYKCERVWYNCTDKDRINNYYKYYKIPGINEDIKVTKASNTSKIYFPIGIKKKSHYQTHFS